MKKNSFFLFFCLFVVVSRVFGNADEVLFDRLNQAVLCSKQASFSSEIVDKKLLENFNASSCRFERYVDSSGGVFSKLLFYDKNKHESCILLHNVNGFYAYDGDIWQQLTDIFPLKYYDFLWEEPLISYEYISEIIKKKVIFEGRACFCIDVGMKNDLRQMSEKGLLYPKYIDEKDASLIPPAIRSNFISHALFFIDEETGVILGKKYYNMNKKIYFSRRIIGFSPNVKLDKDDFMPGKIKKDGQCLFLHDFINYYQNKLGVEKDNEKKQGCFLWSEVARFLFSKSGSYMFFTLGIIAAGSVIWLQKRK